ncbi:MAG: hypothetical protein IJA44_06665 [Clostridia bacterium]|nr:hypothetical protein [Clostridia bacterium]
MIIEFTGVPCSGKSDISHELANILRKNGFSVCEKQYEISHSDNSKKRALKKVLTCFLYCIRHPKRAFSFYRLIGSAKCWMNYIYLFSLNCKNDICILEQGYLQLIGSFFDNVSPDMQRMSALFKALIPEKYIIQVFISASKETILNRANFRNDKPFFVQAEASQSSLEYSIATCNLLQKIWCQNKGEKEFIFISNEKNNAQHEVAQEVYKILKQRELL